MNSAVVIPACQEALSSSQHPRFAAELGRGYLAAHDYDHAREAFRHAADAKYPFAQVAIGMMEARGEGTPQSDVQALSWYRLAADQGDPLGQLELGRAYWLGLGVPKDVEKARTLLMQAGYQHFAPAEYTLSTFYLKTTPRSETDADKWLELSVSHGYDAAQSALANEFKNGIRRPLSLPEAIRLFRLAAAQGNVAAEIALGNLYASGEGVALSKTQAMRYYQLAADQGNAGAAELLAELKDPARPRQRLTEQELAARDAVLIGNIGTAAKAIEEMAPKDHVWSLEECESHGSWQRGTGNVTPWIPASSPR